MHRDIRTATRSLRRSPTFTITVVLILGLGIGAATAMWTVFNAVSLRRPPVDSPDRVVLPSALDQAGHAAMLSQAEVDWVRHESRTMRDMAAVSQFGAQRTPLLDGDRPMPLARAEVDGHFFDVIGAHAVLGRLLNAADDSTSHVMVLSYDAWQRDFGGDSSVLGRRFRSPQLSVTYTVVGVAPPGIDYPAGTDYWRPQAFDVEDVVIARLAPGATMAEARAEFLTLAKQAETRRANPKIVTAADIRTLDTAVVGDVRPVLVLLVAAVGLLLVIACVNVGNLLLLRATGREREIAVRRALGATYGMIVRTLLAEITVLGVAAAVLGLIAAEVARRLLLAAAPPALPRLDAIRASGMAFGTTASIALGAVILCGLLPALTAVSANPVAGRVTQRRRRIRQLLVGAQVALALMLVAGAGLLARSLARLQSLDLGFRADHLSVLSISAPLDTSYHLMDKADQLFPRLAAIPGVTAVTPIIIPPFFGPNFLAGLYQADWQTPEEAKTTPPVPLEIGGPDYFRTFGIPVIQGRGFLDSDRASSEAVVVVSQTLARRYWPGQDPIGKHIRQLGDTSVGYKVVGVAGESRFRSLRDAVPMIYLDYHQYFWAGFLAIRTTSDIHRLEPAIRRAINETDPALTLWSTRTMDDYLDEPLAQPRLSAFLMSAFGFVALALAAIGLYGIMASAVREQQRELGVRMALGATPARVEREVLGRALTVSVIGAAVGLAGALASTGLVRSLLFGVSPTDPMALVGACATLLAVAFVAAYLPARHASRIDPAKVLKAD